MAAPSSSRSLTSAFKRLKLSPSTPAAQYQRRTIQSSSRNAAPTPSQSLSASHSTTSSEQEMANLRLPKAVQATYLAPLKRQPPPNAVTSAELKLRSYSVRNLEVFADFALRAAYFLNLPAFGPRPLPRKIQRWTLPRSNFVHKKSQETFERITVQRMIEIKGGHPETVAIWLAFLRKHQYYGVGMKANVYDYGGIETGKDLDAEAERITKMMGDKRERFETFAGKSRVKRINALFEGQAKSAWGAGAALGGRQRKGSAEYMLSWSKIASEQSKALEDRDPSE